MALCQSDFSRSISHILELQFSSTSDFSPPGMRTSPRRSISSTNSPSFRSSSPCRLPSTGYASLPPFENHVSRLHFFAQANLLTLFLMTRFGSGFSVRNRMRFAFAICMRSCLSFASHLQFVISSFSFRHVAHGSWHQHAQDLREDSHCRLPWSVFSLFTICIAPSLA